MILLPLPPVRPLVRPLGDPAFVIVPVPGARVAAISADGRTVVGTSEKRAFSWRRDAFRDTDPDGQGTIEILSSPGAALGVSDDGSVVVGNGLTPPRAERGGRRWVGTLLAAPPPVGPRIGGAAVGVSGDGRVVVGTTVLNYEASGRGRRVEGYGEAAFLFDRPLLAKPTPTRADGSAEKTGDEMPRETAGDETTGGQIAIGERTRDQPGGVLRQQPEPSRGFALGWGSAATAVSGDGATIVGTLARRGPGFRWTEGGAILPIGDLPGGRVETIPNAVSGDGAAIVGSAESKSGVEAFRWSEADGMVGLGDLPGGRFRSAARAVSADGSVVVGVAAGAERDEAFVWDAEHGMRPLAALVKAPAGWRLLEAVAVRPAPGGWLVAGNGFDADGQAAGFLATVSSGG